MFIEEELKADERPSLAVCAPSLQFLLKYLDREFNMRITDNPSECAPGNKAFVILGVGEPETAAVESFRQACKEKSIEAVTLRLPTVIGTGMGGNGMRIAKGVSRGTMMKIKDNPARWSVVHAVDVALAAKALNGTSFDATTYNLSAPAVEVNKLIEAFGIRIKDKRTATINRFWARLLYGKAFFDELTSDNIIDTSAFGALFPDFEFTDPTVYLTTHNYNDESL